MEVGLDLVAVWEDGLVFDAKQLHVDEAEYAANIAQAASWAFNLAVEIALPLEETTGILLQKAFREAKAVAIESAILTEDTKEEIVARSEREALFVKKVANL
jgi:large subunit ribosomal protein L10